METKGKVLERTEDLTSLMRAANLGDEAAYRRLLTKLAVPLRSIARRGLARAGRGNDDTEDIVQETLLAIHLKRHTWIDSQPLEPWVRAIAHHKLVDALRRRGFRHYIPLEDCDEIMSVNQQPIEFSEGECADVLATLPERQRQIVQSISIEGRSAREVADRLGMQEGAVRVALHRALKVLADSYRRDEP